MPLRLGGFDDLDEGGGVGGVEEIAAKVVLAEKSGEGSHHPEIIGDHLLGSADQKNQAHRTAILGFKSDAVAAAPDGDEDVGTLVGAGVRDGHIMTEGGIADPLALEDFVEERLEIA